MASATCGKCGTRYPPDHEFCPQCFENDPIAPGETAKTKKKKTPTKPTEPAEGEGNASQS